MSVGDWYWRDGTRVDGPMYPEPGWVETMQKLSAKAADPEYKRVAWTDLGPDEFVSTVWLGMDHRFGGGGRPLIFETMHGPSWDDCERYCTEEEALAGHAAMVKRYRR